MQSAQPNRRGGIAETINNGAFRHPYTLLYHFPHTLSISNVYKSLYKKMRGILGFCTDFTHFLHPFPAGDAQKKHFCRITAIVKNRGTILSFSSF